MDNKIWLIKYYSIMIDEFSSHLIVVEHFGNGQRWTKLSLKLISNNDFSITLFIYFKHLGQIQTLVDAGTILSITI